MAKTLSDSVFDAALNVIKTTATRMVLCSAQPTTYTEAITTYMLVDVTMVNGDFTISNGDVSGRKLRVVAKAGEAVSNAGTGNHVALVDVSGTALLVVDTCPAKVVATDDLVDFALWDIELTDPT